MATDEVGSPAVISLISAKDYFIGVGTDKKRLGRKRVKTQVRRVFRELAPDESFPCLSRTANTALTQTNHIQSDPSLGDLRSIGNVSLI